ncbi:MAG: hypothetical protein Q9225_006728 [Loekoesia sp. 1 TL-2023]
MHPFRKFWHGLLSLCNPDAGKREEKPKPRISAPMGEVKYDPKPSNYDPHLPPPIFSISHYPYQPGRKYDSYGDSFHAKSIGLPRNHPLRKRITSSLYSRPSDGGSTYLEKAHPRRPASSVYSRPTNGSPYSTQGRSIGLPPGLRAHPRLASGESSNTMCTLSRELRAAGVNYDPPTEEELALRRNVVRTAEDEEEARRVNREMADACLARIFEN